jgi:cobalamin biosynthesis Mg chelatase CobN
MSNVPRWSAPAPRKFSNLPFNDPYVTVKAGSHQPPKERPLSKAAMIAARAEATAASVAEVEKPKKEKRVVQKPIEDSDGWTEVASRERPDNAEKPKSTAAAVDTHNSYAAVMMDEPVEKKDKAPKAAESAKQESKGSKKKKEKAQPKKEKAAPPKKGELKKKKRVAAAAATSDETDKPQEQREQKTKKKSGGKRGSRKGSSGGQQSSKTKEQGGLPIAWVVVAAVVAAGVAFYFAKTQM